MSGTRHIAEAGYTQPVATACEAVQAGFSAYLDSAMSGVEMAAMGAHMENCAACSEEFAAWRAVQQALGDIGPAVMPASLQNELRATMPSTHAEAISRWVAACFAAGS
jgi:anti-sigma factor RsiW